MSNYREELLKAIRQYNLDHYRDIAAIADALRAGMIDESAAETYLLYLEPEILKARICPNLLPPTPEEDELLEHGPVEIELGTLENGLRWGISPKRTLSHVLICGTTNAGKSVTLRRIIGGLKNG